MTRVLAPWLRLFRPRAVPTKLRVIEGGKSAGVVTLVPARTFDELDRCPFEEAFGDVASIPHEGRVT